MTRPEHPSETAVRSALEGLIRAAQEGGLEAVEAFVSSRGWTEKPPFSRPSELIDFVTSGDVTIRDPEPYGGGKFFKFTLIRGGESYIFHFKYADGSFVTGGKVTI